MLAGTKNLQPIDNPIGSRLSPMSPVRSVTYVSGPDRRLRGGAGRTRTNHQSVMEYGRVRPAHPVGHQTSSSKRPAVDGHFYKRESRVAVTRHGKSRCSPHDGSLLPPQTAPPLGASAPVKGSFPRPVRLLSVPGVRQGELVGHPHARGGRSELPYGR